MKVKAIDSAPKNGEFLAPDKNGDWLRVKRADEFVTEFNGIGTVQHWSGRFWVADRWIPIPDELCEVRE